MERWNHYRKLTWSYMKHPENIRQEERNQMAEDIHRDGWPDQEKPEPRDTQKRHEEIKQRDSERQQERNRDHTNTYREQESKRIEKEQQQEREDERQPGDQWKTQGVDGDDTQERISEPPVAPENVDDIDGRVIDLEDRMGTQEDDQDPGGSLKYGKWIGGGGGIAYTLDYCIVGNQQVAIPEQTTDFLQILFGSSPSASWVAAMPETQPTNGVVIDVTKNRFYFTGEFGNG